MFFLLGYVYFSLVDEKVTDRFGQRLILPCVFFRGDNQHLRFKLVDGLKVLCLGAVTIYEGRGQYQLRVLRVEPKGVGALQLAFEQLKRRLEAEGLFESVRKRVIPQWPSRIGIITSRSGSAIHDMVSKLRGYYNLVIVPVKVQGEGAAQEIADALDLANAMKLADVLIVGRGGGSVEDLWAFNEEGVARAIARSHIPVISAVGHQDDWTISDYVADLRASTPTDAAKGLVQEQKALADRCQALTQQLFDVMQGLLDEDSNRLSALTDRLRLLHPLHQLNDVENRVRQYESTLVSSMQYRLIQATHVLQGFMGRLQALSPLAVLSRGYSITFSLPDRHIVREAAALKLGDDIETLLANGRVTSTVTKLNP